jgi:hypothetical protein
MINPLRPVGRPPDHATDAVLARRFALNRDRAKA